MDNKTYQEAALATLAGSETFEDYIDRDEFNRDTFGFVVASAALERHKKALAYGKNISSFKTINPIRHPNIDALHAKLGIAGEAGEIFDAETKEDVAKEAGDILWYIAVLLKAYDLTFDEVMQGNIDKLSKRYATGKFTREEALKRADMA